MAAIALLSHWAASIEHIIKYKQKPDTDYFRKNVLSNITDSMCAVCVSKTMANIVVVEYWEAESETENDH